MNTLLEAPAHEAETVDLCRDAVGVVRKTNERPRIKAGRIFASRPGRRAT
jgi:hypothetical protein